MCLRRFKNLEQLLLRLRFACAMQLNGLPVYIDCEDSETRRVAQLALREVKALRRISQFARIGETDVVLIETSQLRIFHDQVEAMSLMERRGWRGQLIVERDPEDLYLLNVYCHGARLYTDTGLPFDFDTILEDEFFPLVAYGFFSDYARAKNLFTTRLPRDIRQERATADLYQIPRCECCDVYLFENAQPCKFRKSIVTLTSAGRAAQERRRQENTRKFLHWKRVHLPCDKAPRAEPKVGLALEDVDAQQAEQQQAAQLRAHKRSEKKQRRQQAWEERNAPPMAASQAQSVQPVPPVQPVLCEPVQCEAQPVDEEVAAANASARLQKQARRRAAVQANLPVQHQQRQQPIEDQEQVISNRVARRRRKQEELRRRVAAQSEKQQQREQQAFTRLGKVVAALSEDSEIRLQATTPPPKSSTPTATPKSSTPAATPKRKTEMELCLADAIKSTGMLRGRMVHEIHSFVKGYSGVAPEPEPFGTKLTAILLDACGVTVDMAVAEQVYGPFADSFLRVKWNEPRLAAAHRASVLMATAAV